MSGMLWKLQALCQKQEKKEIEQETEKNATQI